MCSKGVSILTPVKTFSAMASEDYLFASEVRTESESTVGSPRTSFRKLKRSDSTLEDEDFDPELESRVLVLYTGGTIGMKSHNGVYSPVPNFLLRELRQSPLFHDSTFKFGSQTSVPKPNKPLVLPHVTNFSKRIIYTLFEYEPLLDSANMGIDEYVSLAHDIKENYTQYDGFVILHGTDTMAYTASALSYMLEYLGKPVILTGSQIPIFELRSDGRDNFIGALLMAGLYVIPEVMVYFHNQLLRGNRTSKANSAALNAFTSPNMHPLADMEISIKVHYEAIFRMLPNSQFRVHDRMCKNVGVLRLFPGITVITVHSFLQPPMQGVVLQSYGAGNGPDARTDLLDELKAASDRGLLIVNITQCQQGRVFHGYATGKALSDAGVISGSDMTPEAALMKLSYVLGKTEWDIDRKRKMMELNLRGELTEQEQGRVQLSLIETLAKALRISSDHEKGLLREAIIPSLMCNAARNGDIAALQKLQDSGADFKIGDHDGRTALHVAVCSGQREVVKWLLDRGAMLHVKDRYGHTALDDAVRFCQLDLIALLKEKGATLVVSHVKLSLQLQVAVLTENRELLESWFRAGADMNIADTFGKRPLHVAVAQNSVDIVEDLLRFGANPNFTDKTGLSPIDLARNDKNFVVLKILEEGTRKESSTQI